MLIWAFSRNANVMTFRAPPVVAGGVWTCAVVDSGPLFRDEDQQDTGCQASTSGISTLPQSSSDLFPNENAMNSQRAAVVDTTVSRIGASPHTLPLSLTGTDLVLTEPIFYNTGEI
jgi:hypothetical protein